MLRIVSVDDGQKVIIASRVFNTRVAAYRVSMTTSTLTSPTVETDQIRAREFALTHLERLRSDLRSRELEYLDTRAKLLLAYRQARREGLTDNDLSGSAGASQSIMSRDL
jgi:hypothetical protein